MIRGALWTGIVFLAIHWGPCVSADIVDQDNYMWRPNSWHGIGGARQTFMPGLPNLTAVDIRVRVECHYGKPQIITMKIFRDTQTIASVSVQAVEDFDGVVRFQLPEPLRVTVDETLLMYFSTKSSDGIGCSIDIGRSGNSYDRGMSFSKGSNPMPTKLIDYVFRTWGEYDPLIPVVWAHAPRMITESTARFASTFAEHRQEDYYCRFRYWIEGQAEESTEWAKYFHGNLFFTQDVEGLVPGRDYSCIAEVRSPFGTGTSDAIHFRTLGETQAILTVIAGAGGSVITPNSRFIATEMDAEQRVEANALGNCYFAAWSGSAVLAGKVDDPSSAATVVTMDSDYTLKANFLSLLDTIHVDDDALHDPGPCDVSTSDPAEDGTNEHPYDSIQEAIDVAREHTTILVRDGVYYETIHVRAKSLDIRSVDSDAVDDVVFPVVDAEYANSVATFDLGEDTACSLTGFVLTRGYGQYAGGVKCVRGNLLLQNCLIVGNRCQDAYGSAIYCSNSNWIADRCTISDNYGGQSGAGIAVDNCVSAINNCIIWHNASAQIQVLSGNDPVVLFSNIQDAWPGQGNINTNPSFAAPGDWADATDPNIILAPNDPTAMWLDGDYHLKSEMGRWDSTHLEWVSDQVTSPCIDAGDPLLPILSELQPNGNRVNMGAYGSTDQASLSPVSSK